MTSVAKYIVILFGIFLVGVGLLMLLNPDKARAYLKKAGSTNLVNYLEITIRMIPAASLILYAEYSKFPEISMYFGWFMIGTSVILYFIPRRLHHRYALICAKVFTPNRIKLTSPFSILIGIAIIYSVM